MFNEQTYTVVGKSFDVGGDMLTIRFSFSYDKVYHLVAEVIKMNDKLRGKGILIKYTEDEESPFIGSGVYPELKDGHLYINGSHTDADGPTFWVYKTAEERNRAMTILASLVEQINAPHEAEVVRREDGTIMETVGSAKLKICFMYKEDGQRLSFKILSQDESLRKRRTFLTNGDFELKSADSPELSAGRNMYIRGGRRDADSNTPGYNYESHDKMKEALSIFKEFVIGINFPWITKTKGE
jgi:hypothetical protein